MKNCSRILLPGPPTVESFLALSTVARLWASNGGYNWQRTDTLSIMRFCGIDLAAEAKSTGLATVVTDDSSIRIEALAVGVTDEHIIAAICTANGTGVDVPVGWPKAFVDFIQHHGNQTLEAPDDTGGAWRRTLALRTTDIDLHRRTGLTPLSVSANLIAYPAFRWAGLEARLRDQGVDVSRDGSGAVAEVYPAAALYRWGIAHRGYKRPQQQAVRAEVIEGLSARFDHLDWNGFDALALANHDALDAVIAALVRYQISRGQCEGPPEDLRDIARTEGWIWVPKPAE